MGTCREYNTGYFNRNWIMKKSELKQLIGEIVKEISKDETNENLRGLAAAGLMGYAALHNPSVRNTWNQQVQRQQTYRQQDAQRRQQSQDQTKELPSEKGMDGFDLAQKYSDRNASLAKKLKPATDAWMNEISNQQEPQWDFNKYKILKKAYNRAVAEGKSEFKIGERVVLVSYAKLVLQYLKSQFGGIR